MDRRFSTATELGNGSDDVLDRADSAAAKPREIFDVSRVAASLGLRVLHVLFLFRRSSLTPEPLPARRAALRQRARARSAMAAAPLVDLPGVFRTAVSDGVNPFVAVRQALSHALAPHTSRAFAIQLRILLGIALAILVVQLITLGVKAKRRSLALFVVRATRIGSFITPTSTAWMVRGDAGTCHRTLALAAVLLPRRRCCADHIDQG